MKRRVLSSEVNPKEAEMSKSYRKYLSWPSSEFNPLDWHSIRNEERKCIHAELNNPAPGDILFPQHYGSQKGSWSSSSRYYYSKTEIRNEYFKEIRNILNGYQDWHWFSRRIQGELPYEDYQENFIYAYNLIKSSDGKLTSFNWLNTREAKEAVKNWEGDPLEILHYLTSTGIIEIAVRNECRRLLKK